MGAESSRSRAVGKVAPAAGNLKKGNKVTPLATTLTPSPIESVHRGGTIVLDDTGVLSGGSDSDISREEIAAATGAAAQMKTTPVKKWATRDNNRDSADAKRDAYVVVSVLRLNR